MSNEQRFELRFGIDMLPAMLQALSLARCTAMMCSGRGDDSLHHAFDEQYRVLIEQIGGKGAPGEVRSHVPDDDAWWAACMAVRRAGRLHFHEFRWVPSQWNHHPPYHAGDVWVVVDGRSHAMGHGHRVDDVLWPRFREALELLAPIEVVREPDVHVDDVPADRRVRRRWP